jgi:hypothetical protein
LAVAAGTAGAAGIKQLYQTEVESWRELQYRIHHEAVEGAGREWLTRIFVGVFLSYRHA